MLWFKTRRERRLRRSATHRFAKFIHGTSGTTFPTEETILLRRIAKHSASPRRSGFLSKCKNTLAPVGNAVPSVPQHTALQNLYTERWGQRSLRRNDFTPGASPDVSQVLRWNRSYRKSILFVFHVIQRIPAALQNQKIQRNYQNPQLWNFPELGFLAV